MTRPMPLLALCLGLGLAMPVYALAHDHTAMSMEHPLSGQSIYNIPNTWESQDGQMSDLKSLRGQPVVIAMVYTNCKDMCPLTVEAMRQIGDEWAKRSHHPVTFVLVSFDDVRDTPQHLKEYAEAHKLDARHWTLFHGDASAVRNLAAVLGVAYRKDANGDFDHAYAITLLDAEGVIAYQQTGVQQDMGVWMAMLGNLTGSGK